MLELISNGTFLMDTSSGESERAMADLALDGVPGSPRVLIAGLGFGFTLDATLSHHVGEVLVVELEPHVVAWNEQWWALGRSALRDPRVRVEIGDIVGFVSASETVFDAVLLDVDNGPDWTVAAPNDDLYDVLLPDLRRIVRAPQGRLCVWSASRSAGFERRLAEHFDQVSAHEVPVRRGHPDVLYLATA